MTFLRASRFAAIAMVIAACESTTEPLAEQPRLLVDLGESGGFGAVAGDFSFMGHFGDFNRLRSPMFVDASASAIYFVAAGDAPAELVRFSPRRLAPVHRELTTAIEARGALENVRIDGRLGILALADGTVILDGARGAVPGLVTLSPGPYTPTTFTGPFYLATDGFALMNDRLFIVASRTENGARYLFELDPSTLALGDSIAAPNAQQVIASPDHPYLYVLSDSIRKFDSTRGVFVASLMNPTPNLHSQLFVSADGQTLYLNDPGNFFEYPGPGVIYSWDDHLNRLPDISLTDVSDGVPVVAGLATSSNGDTLFVATGTRSLGPLYGPQPAALWIVNGRTGSMIRRVDLGGWSPGAVIVLPQHF